MEREAYLNLVLGIGHKSSVLRALANHVEGGKLLPEAMAAYENEVVRRGRKAVEESAMSSLMVHEWEEMRESILFRNGMRQTR